MHDVLTEYHSNNLPQPQTEQAAEIFCILTSLVLCSLLDNAWDDCFHSFSIQN